MIGWRVERTYELQRTTAGIDVGVHGLVRLDDLDAVRISAGAGVGPPPNPVSLSFPPAPRHSISFAPSAAGPKGAVDRSRKLGMIRNYPNSWRMPKRRKKLFRIDHRQNGCRFLRLEVPLIVQNRISDEM